MMSEAMVNMLRIWTVNQKSNSSRRGTTETPKQLYSLVSDISLRRIICDRQKSR